jgi:putative ABC transport system permease protein
MALSVFLLYAALLLLQPYVDATRRLHLPIEAAKPNALATLATIGIAGCLTRLLPALRACRLTLADGMAVRAWPSET